MKLGTPLLTTDMSGKLGGLVAAKARGGVLYARARVRPSNPRTSFQTTVRVILAAIATAWRSTLNQTQRDGWSALAGPTESGIDVFAAFNSQSLRVGGATLTEDAPATRSLDWTPYLTPVLDASDHTLTFDYAVPADRKVNIYATRPQSASRGSRQFSYQYIGTIEEADTNLVLTSLMPPYPATAGQVVYIKTVPYGTASPYEGQVATPQEFRVVVQA